MKKSDLIGMYVIYLDDNDKIKNRFMVTGQVNETHFILTAISPVDGQLNISKVVSVEKLKDTYLINHDFHDEFFKDYYKYGFRFSVSVL